MTIQEAIKSGRYFHRPRHNDDIFYVKYNELFYGFKDYSEEPPTYIFQEPEYSGFEIINAKDILADDWEIIDIGELNIE